jgi:DNA repair exonuclease SbcCD nuclease subunit
VRFRFVHAADLHLDTPFDGIGQTNPAIAERLRDASLEAFDALVQLTVDREAAFLLLAGDIYDGVERGVRAQLRFLRGLECLAAHGIRVLIVHGNHDPIQGWSAIRHWPEGVTLFGAHGVATSVVARGGDRLATIYGISFGKQEVTENLSRLYRREPGPGLHVGLLHCNVGHCGEHAAYAPCSVDDLVAAGMDYWAIGHVHRRQFLRQGKPWIVYPGNLQGRSLKSTEQGPKGAVVVEAEGAHVRAVEFVPLDRVRFVPLSLDIAEIDDLPALKGRLMAELDRLRQEHEGRAVLVRAHIRGRGPVHGDLRRPNALDDLLRELRGETEGESLSAWWESLRDETRSQIDRERIRERGDLSAELIRCAERIANHPESLADFLRQHVGTSKRGVFARWFGEVEPVSDRELVEQAEALALDYLAGEDDG